MLRRWCINWKQTLQEISGQREITEIIAFNQQMPCILCEDATIPSIVPDGPRLNIKNIFTAMVSIIKIRRSWDRLIFIMGSYTGKTTSLYWDPTPPQSNLEIVTTVHRLEHMMICDCFSIVIYTDWPCALSSPRLDKFAHYKSPLLLSLLLSGVPDYFDRNKILSGYDLSHYQVPHCIKSFLLFCLICVYSSQFSILFWIMYLL